MLSCLPASTSQNSSVETSSRVWTPHFARLCSKDPSFSRCRVSHRGCSWVGKDLPSPCRMRLQTKPPQRRDQSFSLLSSAEQRSHGSGGSSSAVVRLPLSPPAAVRGAMPPTSTPPATRATTARQTLQPADRASRSCLGEPPPPAPRRPLQHSLSRAASPRWKASCRPPSLSALSITSCASKPKPQPCAQHEWWAVALQDRWQRPTATPGPASRDSVKASRE
mmetsp:Transcript_12286/g.28734  ORF Transcript_12286/g.28734 Transcript_12286/m.28734 type:complete len:222 (+) Transcript_12286:476-1141(+)